MLHGVLLLERCVNGIDSNCQSVFRTGQSHGSPVNSFLQLCRNSTGQGLNGISFALGARPWHSAWPCCCVRVTLTFNLLIDSGGQGPSFSTSDGQSQVSIPKPKEGVPSFMVVFSHDGTQNGHKLPSAKVPGGLRDLLENLPRRSTGGSN